MDPQDVAFQTAAAIRAAPQHRTQVLCGQRRTSPTATAVFPSKTSVKKPSTRTQSINSATTTKNASSATTTSTTTTTTRSTESQHQLLEYEKFLKSKDGAVKTGSPIEAPVFQTTTSALACQWSPAIEKLHQPHSQPAEILREYQQFLATPLAKDVDLSHPVYLTPSGHLVSSYP